MNGEARGFGIVDAARRGLVRTRMRSRLDAIVAGSAAGLAVESGWRTEDLLLCVEAICQENLGDLLALRRLASGLKRGRVHALLLDQLWGPDPKVKRRVITVLGRLEMDEVVPWLAPFLGNPDEGVRVNAARALGRIGGGRASDALVKALYWRRGSLNRVVMELARAAPDLYLERALVNPHHSGIRASLAVAAGLRRRRTAVASLMHVVASGSRAERIAACRALGWIGDRTVVPAIQYLLGDAGWQVRVAAAKALGQIGEPDSERELLRGFQDRNLRVRRSVEAALKRIRQPQDLPISEAAAWA
jgi:HEAT repeat protein